MKLSNWFIKGINFSQKQQFITQYVLMATCFDSIESSSGLPKNRSNVSKCIGYFGIAKAYNSYYRRYSSTCVGNLSIHIMEYI